MKVQYMSIYRLSTNNNHSPRAIGSLRHLMLKFFYAILKTVPFSVNNSFNSSTFSSLLCQQFVKSLSKRRALTFSSCHILLSSFSHLVSAEYEAEGSKGEEKGAKRSEETNRGWSEVGDGNIVKTKYKFLSLSVS